MIEIITAEDDPQLDAARELFREYAASLGFDLCFQGFEDELAALPGPYAAPGGRLLLARTGDAFVGCVGYVPLVVDGADDGEGGRASSVGVCEVKRLYVRPDGRRRGTGRLLVKAAIAAAREAGYRAMWLHTLEAWAAATALYEAVGFGAIEPYADVPVAGVRFFGLEIR